jgi:hypothetical protein
MNDHVSQYAVLSDEKITQLASEGGLRPEADIALREEMRKRSIGATDVRSLRVKQKKAKLQARVGNNPDLGRGTRLELRGHKFLTEADERKGIAVVTRWIVFAFMPLIPIGSYRVKESVEGDTNPEIVGKAPLQWDQVLDGWKKAAIIILVFVSTIIGIVWWEHLQGR